MGEPRLDEISLFVLQINKNMNISLPSDFPQALDHKRSRVRVPSPSVR